MSISRLTRTVALLDGLGSVGALVMAFAAPCCLPLFAMIAGAVGITALGLNEKFVLFALQAFAVIAVIGLAFAASRLRQFGPLILGGLAAFVLFFSFHARFSALLVYLGLVGAMRCQRVELPSFTKAQRRDLAVRDYVPEVR